MDLENRIVEGITNHPSIDIYPSYSPDGKVITFNSDEGLSANLICCCGSKVKNFIWEGLYGTPVWSPRSDLIAFTKLHKENFIEL